MTESRVSTKQAGYFERRLDLAWQARFGLTEGHWRPDVVRRIERNSFLEASDFLPLLEFLFDDLPRRLAHSRSADYRRVADAFGWLCFQAWQTGSHFPTFAENYAGRLLVALKAKRLLADARLIADFVLADGIDGLCGFQRLALADPDFIRQSETWLCDGEFEPFLKARAKYDEYARRLSAEPEFRRDWRALKKVFPRETSRPGILHRTLVPERNWVRDGGAKFSSRRQRFQAAFDLLCWKYCLWGVTRGRPLLLKPSVVLTPHGTQIFIPAYLSFDAKRDLDLGLITRLHRARGLQRQGEGFSVSRTERARLRKQARAADAEAHRRGLRGTRRYAFITQQLGLMDHGDYRPIRRLLQK
jgi:hypothetical protein